MNNSCNIENTAPILIDRNGNDQLRNMYHVK